MRKEMSGLIGLLIGLFSKHFPGTSSVPDACLGEGRGLWSPPTGSVVVERTFWRRRDRH